MLKQRDIRAFNARYHRNGVSGEGFYLCEFLYLRGKHTKQMRAVVFDAPGHVAVMSEDIGSRWHGDDFEPALRAALEAVGRHQPESLYQREAREA